MSIVLGSITLPPYLRWEDELAWSAVEQQTGYYLSGSMEIQESVKLAGRPITLSGEKNRGWISRATLMQLFALAQTPQELALNYHDQEYTVRFNRQSGAAVEATPMFVRIPPKDTDVYHSLIIRLLVVE